MNVHEKSRPDREIGAQIPHRVAPTFTLRRRYNMFGRIKGIGHDQKSRIVERIGVKIGIDEAGTLFFLNGIQNLIGPVALQGSDRPAEIFRVGVRVLIGFGKKKKIQTARKGQEKAKKP